MPFSRLFRFWSLILVHSFFANKPVDRSPSFTSSVLSRQICFPASPKRPKRAHSSATSSSPTPIHAHELHFCTRFHWSFRAASEALDLLASKNNRIRAKQKEGQISSRRLWANHLWGRACAARLLVLQLPLTKRQTSELLHLLLITCCFLFQSSAFRFLPCIWQFHGVGNLRPVAARRVPQGSVGHCPGALSILPSPLQFHSLYTFHMLLSYSRLPAHLV